MKTRIIAAAVLIPVMLLLIMAAPEIVTAIVFSLMLAISAYELLYRTKQVRHPRLVIYSALMAFAVGMWSYFGAVHAYAMLGIIVFMVLLFTEMMNNHVKIHFSTLCMCMVGGAVIPYLLSALIRILVMDDSHDAFNGREVILIPIVIAFISDSGAYFAGRFFGKHKLAPVVSPNKTIEGVLGGLVASMLGMIVYGLVMQFAMDYQVNYGIAILYGLLGSAVGAYGDLCFSIIKRQTGIKDYGELIPGHGGILDRFDSMVTVAPLIEALLIMMPLAEEVW